MDEPKTKPKATTAQRFNLALLRQRLVSYFHEPATFLLILPVAVLLAAAVYMRSAWTNFIFDEQEALLANPYVNGDTLKFWEVFSRDFWGLPATGTIGSYRPLPNIIWRLLWQIKEHAWLPHVFNLLMHGVNAAMLGALARRWLGSNRAAWLCALTFVLGAIITEAVCGVVGIADVLGGTFVLLALLALPLAWYWLPLITAASLFLGLLSKESTLTVTPLVPLVGFIAAPLVRPERPQRWLRCGMMGLGVVVAVVGYTYFRRAFFEIKLPALYDNPLPASEPFLKQLMHDFLRWFKQPDLPKDGINNPLVSADMPHRVAGALRVYFRGLMQVVFPWSLSGDYSFPQEPIPKRLVFPESVLGALFMIAPPLLALGCAGRALWLEFTQRWLAKNAATESSAANPSAPFSLSPSARALAVLAIGLLWVPITYFPHSNIPILLPTVRAERFWYLPVIGTSLLIGLAFTLLWEKKSKQYRDWCLAGIICFLGFQAIQGRLHALDYRNDLVFWRATARAVPNSAKAHLNYGVMLGARRQLDKRLIENKRALDLAPEWPMAHIYYADTLCRLHRADEAWPHYVNGFKIGSNQQALIALALQCLWDEKAVDKHKDELLKLAEEFKGSWLAYLAKDIVDNGAKHGGVDPQYRPRSYNGGPREKKKTDGSATATASASATLSGTASGSAASSATTSSSVSATASATGTAAPLTSGSGAASATSPQPSVSGRMAPLGPPPVASSGQPGARGISTR
jgi:hypothetical protein